jgi:hypothetical protein
MTNTKAIERFNFTYEMKISADKIARFHGALTKLRVWAHGFGGSIEMVPGKTNRAGSTTVTVKLVDFTDKMDVDSMAMLQSAMS